ncbi:MAG: acetoacetate--CoA ligase, partial [Gammaproteobacteria bacterium]|nr:acetoacetate--CoA ligase [Gammaproteobacteria bacterium]
RHGLELKDYEGLWQWSVDRREEFWVLLWDFFDVKAARRWDKVLANDGMPGAKWFEGARLNFAENLLRYRDDRTALVFRNEAGVRRSFTYAELYREVARLRAGLDAAGVKTGDRVAAYLPNMPETLIAMLATASIGAVFSSTSPDFGTGGVLDRFGQIEPKILIAADGYFYNGKTHDSLSRVREILPQLPSVERVVVVPHVNEKPDLADLPKAVHYVDFLGDAEEMDFARLPFDHPQFILYSSGTTGKPKCIVHGLGGVLLQHLKELGLHTNVAREDVLFYFTTCGWMMWNWLSSGLALGTTVLLYDGAPMRGGADAMMRMAEEEKITVFGTSAKFISALEKAGVGEKAQKQLAGVRTILSTGSPLMPENFDYVYGTLKPDAQLASISGGTDIVSCFALGCPIKPVWRGELQCRGLGMAVDVFDDEGNPAEDAGELVCTRAFPAMPVSFWNDPEGERYRKAYFERFEGVWCHGDWTKLTGHGGLVIYGRSDAVLNPGGVRIGTAEIYRQVEKLPEIMESLAIGQQWHGDARIVLFVRMQPGEKINNEVAKRIRSVIRENETPRHVPAVILEVPDLPRTRSGKISEIAVRDVVHGRDVKNTEALANPEALEAFRNRPELQAYEQACSHSPSDPC